MFKKIIFSILSILLLVGCSNHSDIESYNNISKEHLDEASIAFGYLSESFNLYNEKKFDESIIITDKCIDSYTKTIQLSKKGKEIANQANFDDWVKEFKDISIKAEELRIKQCELLKSVSTEAKKLNPDSEVIAITINEIADYNNEFNKLQTTLNDMQNQHGNNFY